MTKHNKVRIARERIQYRDAKKRRDEQQRRLRKANKTKARRN